MRSRLQSTVRILGLASVAAMTALALDACSNKNTNSLPSQPGLGDGNVVIAASPLHGQFAGYDFSPNGAYFRIVPGNAPGAGDVVQIFFTTYPTQKIDVCAQAVPELGLEVTVPAKTGTYGSSRGVTGYSAFYFPLYDSPGEVMILDNDPQTGNQVTGTIRLDSVAADQVSGALKLNGSGERFGTDYEADANGTFVADPCD